MPNVMAPRQISETRSPERPSVRMRMSRSYSRGPRHVRDRLVVMARMRRLAPAAAALAMTVAFFHHTVLGGRIFIARDMLRVYYPLHRYWAERVSHAEFPDWFPYDALGQPLPGTLIAGVFHP